MSNTFKNENLHSFPSPCLLLVFLLYIWIDMRKWNELVCARKNAYILGKTFVHFSLRLRPTLTHKTATARLSHFMCIEEIKMRCRFQEIASDQIMQRMKKKKKKNLRKINMFSFKCCARCIWGDMFALWMNAKLYSSTYGRIMILKCMLRTVQTMHQVTFQSRHCRMHQNQNKCSCTHTHFTQNSLYLSHARSLPNHSHN